MLELLIVIHDITCFVEGGKMVFLHHHGHLYRLGCHLQAARALSSTPKLKVCAVTCSFIEEYRDLKEISVIF